MSAVAEQTLEARARELHAAGLGYKRIARELGTSATSVRRMVIPGYADLLRKQSRDAKRRRGGVCENCGAATRYNGHEDTVSRLCADCGAARGGATRRDQILGKGPVQVTTLAFCTVPRRFTEIGDHLGITKGHAGIHLNRMVRYGLRYGLLTRLARGVYIATSSLDQTPGARR